MARAPRARISATSGQGISRLAYQKGYKLRGGLTEKFSSGDGGDKRSYAKQGAKQDKPKGINVSYGRTYRPTDLEDIEGMYRK